MPEQHIKPYIQFNFTEIEETDNPHRVRSRIRLRIPREPTTHVQRGLPTRADRATLQRVQAAVHTPTPLPHRIHGVELRRLPDRPGTQKGARQPQGAVHQGPTAEKFSASAEEAVPDVEESVHLGENYRQD